MARARTTIRRRITVFAAGSIAAVGLAACSGPGGGGSSSLITGSVFSSAPKAPVNPDNPAIRHAKVAMVSASAVKCGFYFDPAKLRQSATTAQAGAGEALTKVQQDYDASFGRTAKALATDPEFCGAGRVATIKSDLNRHLAGDFTTVTHADKGPKEQSAWDWLVDGGQKADAGKLDRNEVFFPSGGAQTATPR
jgi:hypothetical protein